MSFWNTQNIRFDLKVASKRTHYLAFPENGFNLVTQKFERKQKKVIIESLEYLFFITR